MELTYEEMFLEMSAGAKNIVDLNAKTDNANLSYEEGESENCINFKDLKNFKIKKEKEKNIYSSVNEDLENLLKNTNKQEIESKNINPNLIGRESERVEPIELVNCFENKETSRDITLKEIKEKIDNAHITNEEGVRILKNKTTNETVTLSNSSIKKMFNTTMRKDSENIGGILGKTCIANINELFSNSILIAEMNDIKHRTDNKIRRYATATKFKGEVFIVKFTVKELATKKSELTEIELTNNENKNLSMYDLKVGKKLPAEKSTETEVSLAEPSTETVVNRPNDNVIIKDLIEFVNRGDEKYFGIA